MLRAKKSKYKSKQSQCLAGHLHPSKLEASHCSKLFCAVNSGEIDSYEIQREFVFIINDHKICSHFVDFYVRLKDGRFEVHETKGYRHNDWSIKRKLFLALFPDIEYKVIEDRGRTWRRNKKVKRAQDPVDLRAALNSFNPI